MDAFFVSDAHIGPAGSTADNFRTLQFLKFLRSKAARCTHLFIIGDLFDFWFEYRHVIPRYPFQILHQLKILTENGIEIHYLAGNHDFALGDFLEKELNIIIHAQPMEQEFSSKRFYIAHGDGVNPKDRGYHFIKKIIRHPLSKCLFRTIHPDWGIDFAHVLSHLSRNYRTIKDRDALYENFARTKFEEGFDFVVLGHTHRSQLVEENEKCYINTGEWMESYTYGHFDGNRLTLEKWNPMNS